MSMRRAIPILAIAIALAVGVAAGPWLTATAKRLHGEDKPAATAGNGTWYIDQMHPWIIQPTPGTCPICGMDLVPVDPARFAGEIGIDPVVVQNMGVRTATVERAALARSLRTVGTVAIDEALVSDVNLKIAGWIEHLRVDTLWAPVQAGQPLFDLYAPDLYAAQQEYLLALQGRDGPHGAELLAAARTKLRFLDIGDDAIAALEKAGVPARTMTIAAPRNGVVAAKNVNAGTYAMPGMTTMRIADLSQVWIDAVVYEHQLDPALVRAGQTASVVPALAAAQPITARIDYVYPTIDPRLREVRVRLVVDNRDGLLKPGMFATVTISEQAAPALVVPREAVMGTGERHVVFVATGEGRFEPRTVTLGRAGDDGRIAVLAGLQAGERVVTSGQFLLDSETRMREGLAKVMGAGLAAVPAAAPAIATDAALPAPAAAALPALLEAYLAVQTPLAAGDPAPATATAALAAAAEAFQAAGAEATRLVDAVHALAAAADLPAARIAFGTVGAELIAIVQRSGVPAPYAGSLRAFTCGMFKAAPQGGVWIQRGDEAHNPFFGGTGMASCSTADAPLPVAPAAKP